MNQKSPRLTGLRTEEVKALLEKFGKNQLCPEKKENFFAKILHIASEPMFLLLMIAAVIYFLLGEPGDGAVMLIFVVGVIGIDVFQQWKTDKTLAALRDLSAPHITVIRDEKETVIPSTELVPGDLMLIHEGIKIPADGIVVHCSDLCVDESSLTGEPEGVWKTISAEGSDHTDYWRKDFCYAGTLVIQGSAMIRVEKTGAATEYGKIGTGVASAPEDSTPLQKQTDGLVKLCAGIAAVLFALVSAVTYFDIPDHLPGERIIESILSGITLAMAMIPEEFPVILTVFLSMGAWRMGRKHSLVRRLPCVETLGAVSVLCVDKTGTITLNQMTVQDIWVPDNNASDLCEIMGLGCETNPYDPMEKAMLEHCEKYGVSREHLFGGKLMGGYPFTNELKMMGRVWYHDEEIILAVKGSAERILPLCSLTQEEQNTAEEKIRQMSRQGLRVIAVGKSILASEDEIPKEITDCRLILCGLVGLADPPREGIKEDISLCARAGIRVVMITGDNGITASSIAQKIGMQNADQILTGDMLESMSDEELCEKVKTVNIFSRVVPQHKMRIVKAFKENGEIVAMTGDGVNDAPALKYADIGIAMGKRGSEVSREAADIILMDDNFSTIVDTVKDGRRIYDNIRKAVGYVFTVHIPIALSCLFAPMLGIAPAALLLLPLHVVLLELIIDPTCSIVLERQPAESDVMERSPRNPKEKLLTARTLFKSVLQGLVIFAASFGMYLSFVSESPALARSMGLGVMILSNLFLVMVNSSEHDSVVKSVKKMMGDKVLWIANTAVVAGLLLVLYTPLSSFLRLAPLSLDKFFAVVAISALCVLWYEPLKLFMKRMKASKKSAG